MKKKKSSKKSKKRKIRMLSPVVMILVLLVLGGGALYIHTFFFFDKETAYGTDSKQVNHQSAASGQTSGKGQRYSEEEEDSGEQNSESKSSHTVSEAKEENIYQRMTGDLVEVNTTTRPDGDNRLQSFTKDGKYYYYVQKTDATEGHLRITRVLYDKNGSYTKDHMDLKYFGHATNLDCSVYNGTTYLWTGGDCEEGGDRSTTITCFEYKANTTLYHHGSVSYHIPMGDSGSMAENVYPAISPDGKRLCVRYTAHGKQYFQTYDLERGTLINPYKILKQISMSATRGDFQGFDIDSEAIYTIEGSPSQSYSGGSFAPTVVRKYSFYTGQLTKKVVTGASELKFREPEGINIYEKGELELLFASRLSSGQYCNTYVIR